MLRRNSCRSQNHRPLSRSKSSVSIARNPVRELTSIEPFAAERDAYIAATLSYSRAQPQNNSDQKSPRLHRQQSVRFVGPNALPQRRLATRASVAVTAALPRRPVGSPQLSQYSFEPGDDGVSLSSHGNLRKSRSMYTSPISETPNYSLDNSDHSETFNGWLETPRHSSPAKRENEPFWDFNGPTATTPSMGFPNNNREGSIYQTSAGNGRGISDQLVHSEFYEPSESSNHLQSRPSSFFRLNYRHTPHSTRFPKSLRSSSSNTAVLSSTSLYDSSIPSNIPSNQPGLRNTARKISRSLKSRLKSFFGRPKSKDRTVDQAESSTHDLGSNDGSYYGGQTPRLIQRPERASVYQVPSHMPSFHAVPLSHQLKSRQCSFESIPVEDNPSNDDKSRVTSWTDSTSATIAHQPRSANWSRQYTSVPNELEPETSPLSRNQSSIPHRNPSHRGPVVNSQRVYSALMKRLHETRQCQGQPSGQDHMTSDSLYINSLRSGSTIRRRISQTTYEGSSHTIRHVRDEDDVFQDAANSSVTSCRSSASTKSVIRSQKPLDSPEKNAEDEVCFNAGPGQSVVKPHPALEAPKPLLSSRNSAFFASPTCHLFRTTSPYRRALREAMEAAHPGNQPLTPDTQYLNSLSALSLPTRCPSTEGSDVGNERMAYAESVYSNASEDNGVQSHGPPSPSRRTVHASAPMDHGDATIFLNSETQRHPLSSNHNRDVSSASSVEWKTWLSANVSKLEAPSAASRTNDSEEPSSTPQPSRHIREETEIESDGDNLPEDVLGVGLPLRLAASHNNNHPSAPTAMAKTNFQLANPWFSQTPTVNENSPPVTGARSRSIYSKDTTPVGSKGNLRTIPSVTNVKTPASISVESQLGVPRMRSHNTLTKPCPPMKEEVRLKRQSRTRLREINTSAQSSPGLTTAFERQFGVGKTGSPGVLQSKELSCKVACVPPETEIDAGVDEMGRREIDAQVMGSKRMVDLFLSSRRKRTASSQMGQSSDSSSAAFI
ncbi:hypothetical protein TARUN_7143 [Trichoderma arundinaceum]|uniref:Uncharacterized protein n=1 Tax=Trichoderma arundinaceum TaxID=490622 RepID=A0A395NGL3_TRIAR|nr:hypothetical protein TARUN_7143 [Trichoderma arundinaceum]